MKSGTTKKLAQIDSFACLVCGEHLEYVTGTDEKKPVYRDNAIVAWEHVHVYRCRNHAHGRFWMTASGGLKPEPI